MATEPVPTLEIADRSGRRVVVAPAAHDDRIGDLADALGLDPGDVVLIDGHPARRDDSLTAAGVRRGSLVGAGGPCRRQATRRAGS